MSGFNSLLTQMLDELAKRRQELAAELEQVDGAMAAVAGLRSDESGLSAAPRSPASYKDMSYAAATRAALERANREPLTTKVLLRRLAAGGRPVGGADPYRILYRALMKNKMFKNVGGRWALADWYPESVRTGDPGEELEG